MPTVKRIICKIIGHNYPKERPDWINEDYCWQCRRCLKVTCGWIRSRWQ